MKFDEIAEESIVYPGEYLLYSPTQEIVLCGAFIKDKGRLRALSRGKLLEDEISKFKKIQLTQKERRERQKSRCKGCGR